MSSAAVVSGALRVKTSVMYVSVGENILLRGIVKEEYLMIILG